MSPFGAGEAECRSCHALYPTSDLDRYLYCPTCVKALNRRAARWGWAAGGVVALALALWIVLAIRPGPQYRWLWVAPVVVTYGLVAGIGRSVAVGLYRTRGLKRPDG